MHQVCRKCGHCCPNLNKIVHTFKLIGILFMYIVYHCSKIVHTLFKLFTLSGEEFTVYIKHCLCIWQKVWTKLSTLSEKEFTVHVKHCLRIWQKVWTKLSTLLSNCPHFLGINFTIHVKNVHMKHCSHDCLVFKRTSNCMEITWPLQENIDISVHTLM